MYQKILKNIKTTRDYIKLKTNQMLNTRKKDNISKKSYCRKYSFYMTRILIYYYTILQRLRF